MSDPLPRDGIELAKLRLPVSATSPRAARDLIGIVTGQWGLAAEVGFAARLAVCELVTNTLLHCEGMPGSTALVTVRRIGAVLRVEVHDGTSRPPRPRRPGATEESGRGLLLVAELTDECGHYPTPFGKVVWFAIKAHWPMDRVA